MSKNRAVKRCIGAKGRRLGAGLVASLPGQAKSSRTPRPPAWDQAEEYIPSAQASMLEGRLGCRRRIIRRDPS